MSTTPSPTPDPLGPREMNLTSENAQTPMRHRKAERVKHHFLNFAQYNGLHGFAYMRYAVFRTESAFWAIAFLVGLSLTIYDSYGVVQAYVDREVGTKSTIKPDVRGGESLRFRPTLCFEIDSSQFAYAGVDPTNGTNVTDFLSTVGLVADDVVGYLDRVEVPMWDDNYTDFLLLTATMLLDIQRLNTFSFRSYKDVELVGSALVNRTSNTVTLFEQEQQLFVPVYNFYASKLNGSLDITLPRLLQITAAMLLRRMGLRISSTKNGDNFETLELSAGKISWFGPLPSAFNAPEFICRRVDCESAFTYSTVQDETHISFDHSALFNDASSTDKASASHWFVDFSGEIASNRLGLSSLINRQTTALRYGRTDAVTLSHNGLYVALNLSPDRPCTEGAFLFTCRSKCRVEYIRKHCECEPTMLFAFSSSEDGAGTSHLPVCGPHLMRHEFRMNASAPWYSGEECMRIVDPPVGRSYSFDVDSDCVQQCPRECTTQLLDSSVTHLVREKELRGTTAMFTVTRLAYPLVEEYLLVDRANFAAQFGGVLGLYIGGSFLAFLHIFVYNFCAGLKGLAAYLRANRIRKRSTRRKANVDNETAVCAGLAEKDNARRRTHKEVAKA